MKSAIGKGLLILVGIEETDGQEDIDWLCKKIVNLRVFDDENGVMNKSILDINGEILVISQFTFMLLQRRVTVLHIYVQQSPIFLFRCMNSFAKIEFPIRQRNRYRRIWCDMKVELLNDGPVTICMDTKNKE